MPIFHNRVPEIAAERKELADYETALKANARIPWITYLVAALCLGDFVRMCLNGADILEPDVQSLLAAGGNCVPYVLDAGEWWRLFSSGFVHCGIKHLIFNLYVLLSIGPLVERLYGHLLYTLVYLAAMLFGSLFSIGLQHANIVSAGASGAIFGLFGATLAYMLRCRENVPKSIRKQIVLNAGICIGANLLYGLQPGIDNWCHLGGLVGGFAFGWVAAIPLRLTDRQSTVLNRFLALIVLIPAIAIPGYSMLRGVKGSPFFKVQRQLAEVDERFQTAHPEFAGDDENSSAEKTMALLEAVGKEVLTPQIEILEAVPADKLRPAERTVRDSMLKFLATQREASALHLRMLREQDASLEPEVARLYQMAADLAPQESESP